VVWLTTNGCCRWSIRAEWAVVGFSQQLTTCDRHGTEFIVSKAGELPVFLLREALHKVLTSVAVITTPNSTPPAIFGVHSYLVLSRVTYTNIHQALWKASVMEDTVFSLFSFCALPNWQPTNPFANLNSGHRTKFQCLIKWALNSVSRPHYLNTFIIVSVCVARVEVTLKKRTEKKLRNWDTQSFAPSLSLSLS
jgi:hypothetical protein